MTANPLTADQLRAIPLLAGLSDEEIELLQKSLRVHAYAKRRTVVHKGSAGNSLMFLLSGALQVVDTSRDGREIGLNVIRPGAFFGEVAVIDGQPRSATIVATAKSEVAFLPRETALRLIYHCPTVAEAMLNHLARTVRQLSVLRAILGIQSAHQRVFAYLWHIRQSSPGGLEVIEVLPTQQQLAIMANTSRETVSRAIALLVKQRVAEKDRSRLIIRKPELLQRLAQEGSEEPAAAALGV